MYIRFQTAHQYLFIHEQIQHLLVVWKKERKRELYLVEEETEGVLTLRYPGETYIDTVLYLIEPIFFQNISVENNTFTSALGATFSYHDWLIGMYYQPPHPTRDLYFFIMKDGHLEEIPDNEYENVVRYFAEQFSDYFSLTDE